MKSAHHEPGEPVLNLNGRFLFLLSTNIQDDGPGSVRFTSLMTCPKGFFFFPPLEVSKNVIFTCVLYAQLSSISSEDSRAGFQVSLWVLEPR